MAAKRRAAAQAPVIRFVLVTLDAHLAEAFEAARTDLARDLPTLACSKSTAERAVRGGAGAGRATSVMRPPRRGATARPGPRDR